MPMTRAERGRITPDVVAGVVDPVVELLHGATSFLAIGVPGVGVSRGETKHSIAAAADQDGRSLRARTPGA